MLDEVSAWCLVLDVRGVPLDERFDFANECLGASDTNVAAIAQLRLTGPIAIVPVQWVVGRDNVAISTGGHTVST